MRERGKIRKILRRLIIVLIGIVLVVEAKGVYEGTGKGILFGGYEEAKKKEGMFGISFIELPYGVSVEDIQKNNYPEMYNLYDVIGVDSWDIYIYYNEDNKESLYKLNFNNAELEGYEWIKEEEYKKEFSRGTEGCEEVRKVDSIECLVINTIKILDKYREEYGSEEVEVGKEVYEELGIDYEDKENEEIKIIKKYYYNAQGILRYINKRKEEEERLKRALTPKEHIKIKTEEKYIYSFPRDTEDYYVDWLGYVMWNFTLFINSYEKDEIEFYTCRKFEYEIEGEKYIRISTHVKDAPVSVNLEEFPEYGFANKADCNRKRGINLGNYILKEVGEGKYELINVRLWDYGGFHII